MRRGIANDSIARCSALAPAPPHPGSSVWGRVVADVQRRRQHPLDIRFWLLHVLILSHFIVPITASVMARADKLPSKRLHRQHSDHRQRGCGGTTSGCELSPQLWQLVFKSSWRSGPPTVDRRRCGPASPPLIARSTGLFAPPAAAAAATTAIVMPAAGGSGQQMTWVWGRPSIIAAS